MYPQELVFSLTGFMCGTTVLDKDGISAAVVVAEMVVHLASQGTTVLDHLRYLNDTLVHRVLLMTSPVQQ